jgi:hypothetical protein
MAEDEDQEFDSVALERQTDGQILISFGDDSYELSENDAVTLARGLQRVAVNDPPNILVRLETDDRTAFLEF